MWFTPSASAVAAAAAIRCSYTSFGARRGDLDDVEREIETFGLGLDEDASYPMHGDAVGVAVERDDQADDVDGGFVTGGVQREGAVLTATPTHPRSGLLPGLRRASHSTYGQ